MKLKRETIELGKKIKHAVIWMHGLGADGNDFVPIVNCFVDRVDFKVFNRWGNLVFETTDPALNWNGQNMNGTDLAEGTYFYTCETFEQRFDGVVQNETVLSGAITLVRGN